MPGTGDIEIKRLQKVTVRQETGRLHGEFFKDFKAVCQVQE